MLLRREQMSLRHCVTASRRHSWFRVPPFLGNELEDSLRASLAKNWNELERILFNLIQRVIIPILLVATLGKSAKAITWLKFVLII